MTADPAVLRRAADVIREGGLSKGLYYVGTSERTAHCTVGALCEAKGLMSRNSVPLTWQAYEEMELVAEVAGAPLTDTGWPAGSKVEAAIYRWNDHPATTAADVIAVFETAAEKLEADR